MSNKIDIRDDHYKIVCDILTKCLNPTDKVFVYGSRVKWTTKNSSDLDLAVITDRKLFALRDAFEESDLPYKVDILSYNDIPSEFKRNIDSHKVPLLFNWQMVKLGDIGTTVTGSTPSSKITGCFGEDIPFVTPTDFKNYNKNIYTSERYLSKKGKELLHTRTLPKNSIIVTCIGSQMGKSAISRISCITNQQINSIIPNKKINCDFLYYVMVNLSLHISNIARGGTTMPILNKSSFDKLEIPLPPLEEQERIANILSAFDDKIEVNRKICSSLEKMASLLFREKFINNKVSADWEKGKLGDIVDIIDGDRGKNYPKIDELYSEGFCVFLSTKNVPNLMFDFSFIQFISQEKDNILRSGKLKMDDIVLTTRGTVGNIAHYHKYIDFKHIRINSGMVIIRNSHNLMDNNTLFYLLKSQLFIDFVQSTQSGSVQLQLPIRDLIKFNFSIPPKEHLEEFEKTVTPMYEKIKNLQKEIITLTKTRDLLLPRLMRGEV